ncbi:MAG: AMP phosphorylase [Candidatus Altiarchaeales archaeon]|nr:AMP phosphorylase [Candidatus Altiarchaeales archaeon]
MPGASGRRYLTFTLHILSTMKLKVKLYEIETGKPIIVLNEEDMKELGVHIGDRIKICKPENTCMVTAVIDASTELVGLGEIGVFEDVYRELDVKAGDIVDVRATKRPQSIEFIKKKLHGKHLHGTEIKQIIQDVVDNNLSDIELTALVVSSYINGYDMDETVSLTKAMVETGEQINFGENTVDKHCIGGVAGNRTTMLIVPILTAAGLTMPKTSSRAITSPAGTADTMEVLAEVEFSIQKLKDIAKDTGGFIVWGGSVNLAPADDKIIKVEYPLSIDPEGQVLASVMSKKKSVNAQNLVIDIPVGKGSKIEDMHTASELARKFIEVGHRLEINTKCLITDGSSPIGAGIGPALEARDVLMCLEGTGPTDLMNKSLDLSAVLLELSGKAVPGEGRSLAEEILESGKAQTQMKTIIEAQKGNPDITAAEIVIGPHQAQVEAKIEGKVKFIDNKIISALARLAGCPKDHTAGVDLKVAVGDEVDKGDPLFTVWAAHPGKLEDAVKKAKQTNPIQIGGLILEEVV